MNVEATRIRVLVVDDQTMVRQGIRALLSFAGDIDVVAEAGSGEEAIELARVARPHVVLMDIHMPGTDGIATTGRLRRELPETAVIILTTFDHDTYVLEAVRAGACGFLLKDGDGDDLVRAIRSASAGDAVIAPRMLGRLLTNVAFAPAHRQDAIDAVASLTDREREVLRLIAAGCNNQEVSERLHISAATTKTHVGHVFAKLGARDRAQAVVAAYESGLARPGTER